MHTGLSGLLVVPVEKRIDWKQPPIVLIAIVALNVLIFLFYQGGDNALYEKAYVAYSQKGLLKLEQTAYRAYLRSHSSAELIDSDDEEYAIWAMLSDENFATFLANNESGYIPSDKREQWRADRAAVNDLVASISSNAYGLNSQAPSVISVFSHQFLHGGIMHLLGNMVFLLLTGFAVEVALGHKRFLLYYLVSGAGGGLLFAAIQSMSGGAGGNLVGASGAISGVMAMYVVLFGMRKIEFFYWVFVFTGYFRAAAIIMLPAYILKELFMLFFNEGSNVAYTAHIGGFVVGAVLVMATQSFLKQAINDDYLNGKEESIDPYQMHLDSLYKILSQCEFKKGLAHLKILKQQYRAKPELREIEYNLLFALDPDKADEYALSCIGKPGNGRVIAQAQFDYWSAISKEQQHALPNIQKRGIAEAQIEVGRPHTAEELYKSLKSSELGEFETKEQHAESISLIGRKLAMHYREQDRVDKAQRYEDEARSIMLAALSSNGEGAS